MSNNTHKEIYRKDYTPPEYLVTKTELVFQLFKDSTIVTSIVSYVRNQASQLNTDYIFLEGEDLILKSIKLNNNILTKESYTVSETGLTIQNTPDSFTLEIETEIFPDQNSSLEGLYLSSGNYCTQCEAEGFRKITFYPDKPCILSPFTTRIEANLEDCPVLLSNGNKMEEGTLDENRHFVVWQDPHPKPSYLFALVAGDLVSLDDTFKTQSGREVQLQIFVEKRNQKKCNHAMTSLKKSMIWDEEVYGLEYDLDIYMIVAVDDFNMGAMENKGLNVFNSKYVLALPETATDQDYLGIEGVIAHEYFHNWTGNRVTCRDWFQLSLKEGLTVFRDQEFSSDLNSRGVQRIGDVKILRDFQFKEDASAMAHPIRPDSFVEINNFYTVTVYNKGAEVIRMIHTILGKDNFRAGMDLYFKRHDGQAVTCEDFVLAMENASGKDLKLFRNWYRQAGTPTIEIDETWNEKDKTLSLKISQTCPATPERKAKEPFHIPIKIGLLGENGKEIDTLKNVNRLIELKDTEQTFTFENLNEKPVVSLLREFSAPVKITPARSRKELVFLMQHDSDSLNRWDAAWTLSCQVILEVTEQFQQGRTPDIDPLYTKAFKSVLSEKKSDPALIAQAITLPQERYLAQQMDVVDVDNLYKAIRFIKETLASGNQQLLLEVYKKNSSNKEYSIAPDAMARRALKNRVLDYLVSVDNQELLEICNKQYENSNNMTDTIAVLSALNDSQDKLRDLVFSDFYDKWKSDPLVMDKWFALQANSSSKFCLSKIKEFMEYPEFSMKNPNKVRSLIGVFANNNHVRFHEADGSGYNFIADSIIFLNKINPQIGARLSTSFSGWKKYDEERKKLIGTQLDTILETPDLSKNVYEVVSKIR